MTMRRLLCLIPVLMALAACGPAEPPAAAGPAVVRRLTEAQYRNVIADVFGEHIVVAGRFDPILRTDGLLAVGAGRATVTGAAFERYHALARSIAGQVVDPANRDILVGCGPANPAAADDGCARAFYERIGRLLFRRPLAADERDAQVAIAQRAAADRGDFYAGLALGLQGLLEAPDFLFVIETPGKGGTTLDDYSIATRLSFLLWNATPDDALLAAAERGELGDRRTRARQVERMMASPRFADGVRAFFTDMLGLDDIATLQKDTVLYPAFSLAAAEDSREQVLRTLVDLLVARNGDYRDIFTSRTTFLSTPLGFVYRVPVANPGGWTRYEFPEGDQRAGIQTQLSFVALHSHPGKSSPTLRGKAVRELLLCQKVPDPPGTVNFDQFNDPNSPNRTARERLAAHATDPACAGCHKLTDPIGLALENFDGAGQWRDNEKGAPIDAGGEINGVAFADAAGLGKALHDDPAATACVVGRAYSYATGRSILAGEKPVVAWLEKTFAADGYRFSDLIRRIALSDAFAAAAAAGPEVKS
jgi:hypothetical protein